jgi:hypothetical protein
MGSGLNACCGLCFLGFGEYCGGLRRSLAAISKLFQLVGAGGILVGLFLRLSVGFLRVFQRIEFVPCGG